MKVGGRPNSPKIPGLKNGQLYPVPSIRKMAQRIGIFGGTFDPIHRGHLIIAQEMMLRCALDRVVFMPSGEPPHKRNPEMASAKDRATMVEWAVRDYPGFALSRFELSRPGKSYTIDTLRHLRQNMGADTKLFLIIGADNAVDMGTWCNPQGVLDLAQVLVADRPGFDRSRIDPAFKASMRFVQTPLIDISSTAIRARVREKNPISLWVPEAVADYIQARGLYV